MPQFNNHYILQEIPADNNQQGPSMSRQTTCYHTTRSPYYFGSISVIERCQLPVLHQLFKVDEGLPDGLRARRPYAGPILADRHRNERRRWTGRYRHCRLQCWHGVIFSGESRFHLRNADGRLRVWRRRGERYHIDCLVQTDRWGGGSPGVGRDQLSSPNTMFATAELM